MTLKLSKRSYCQEFERNHGNKYLPGFGPLLIDYWRRLYQFAARLKPSLRRCCAVLARPVPPGLAQCASDWRSALITRLCAGRKTNHRVRHLDCHHNTRLAGKQHNIISCTRNCVRNDYVGRMVPMNLRLPALKVSEVCPTNVTSSSIA